jgi:hypothetical protein
LWIALVVFLQQMPQMPKLALVHGLVLPQTAEVVWVKLGEPQYPAFLALFVRWVCRLPLLPFLDLPAQLMVSLPEVPQLEY